MLIKTDKKEYMEVGHAEFGSKAKRGVVTPGKTILFLHQQGEGLVFHTVKDAWDTHGNAFGNDANRETKFKGRIDTQTKEIMVYFAGHVSFEERKVRPHLKNLRSRYRNYTIYVLDMSNDTYLYESEHTTVYKILRPIILGEEMKNLFERKDAWDLMTDAGKALYDWIDNDSKIYKRHIFPTQKKLLNMILDHKYDRSISHKMFEKIVKQAIRTLNQTGEMEDYYSLRDFNDQVTLVAAEFRDRFEVEANLGNYDNKDFLELRNRGKSAKGFFDKR